MNVDAALNIKVPTIPSKVDHLKIHSVSEYVIFDDLLRPLIKFDSNGEIAPDLAESWEIKENFTKFIFTLKGNQYFSDKSLITLADILNTFKELMRSPEIVHGDGHRIKKVYLLNDKQFVIEISESNPFFLTELSAPEFRIIKAPAQNYEITSGPYSLKNSIDKKLHFELNNNYPFNNHVKYKEVIYSSYNQNERLDPKNFKDVDIIWPKSSIGEDEIQDFLQNGYYKYELNLGFSYWLSLNPNTLTFHERLQIKQHLDLYFKNDSFFKKNHLTKSRQLFLPYGPGRLSEEEIDEIEKNIKGTAQKSLRKIKVLLPKNIQKDLLHFLEKNLTNSVFYFYSDFSEYDKMIKKEKFDINLVNNDLSSIDLRSSLIVTFNKSRPLVWTDEKSTDYSTLLASITTSLDSTKRYSSIKSLGEKILKDVIVYPLYYKYGFVLVKKGIDLTHWNKSGAETSSWKVK